MFYALCWAVCFSLFALWSLAAWAFHSIAAWTAANAGALVGQPGSALRVPDWLAPWIPDAVAQALASVLSSLMPVFESLLGWAPALAGALSVVVWVVWGIGSAMLVVLGLAVSAAIAALRRRTPARGRPLAAETVG